MEKYNHLEIEPKWQKEWQDNGVYKTKNIQDKKKYYVLDMFPYPSGVGLHVGHPKGYIATDILSRYKMLKGFNVLHPMGWDAFGLPAENYAIANKVHPREAVNKNIATYKSQLGKLGFTYDWSREINTTDPEYYRWTQWAFLQMYKKGLVYESNEPINWCPGCKTGLANEDLEDGKCERCGSEIEQKPLRQWVVRITDYADRLLSDLDKLDGWEESIKEMQRNWIGKSQGAQIIFQITNSDQQLEIFTTRPDTIFGATYMVVCPEHSLLLNLKSKITNYNEVEEYVKTAKNKSDLERTDLNKDKTGVKLQGISAINPANNKKIPVFVADYVLNGYGTGAIMAVPAHDDRDNEFAKKYNLDIIDVVKDINTKIDKDNDTKIDKDNDTKIDKDNDIKIDKDNDTNNKPCCFTGSGMSINSDFLNDKLTEEAKSEIINWLESNKIGKGAVNYRLKDWVFSRQRYWGEPIPLIHCDKCGVVLVNEDDLPLKLPDVDSYEPSGNGESPLAKIDTWLNIKCPKCGGNAKRETNTMPQWAGSCWYYLRYIDPNNKKALVDKGIEKYWSPVDFYVGGAEHATRHLIYARFWHKFLYDINVVNYDEPFTSLRHVGLILAEDGRKMSKRWNNVINPDDIVYEFGADAMRVYEMFMGPFDQPVVWNTDGLKGARKFLDKIWALQFKINSEISDSNEVLNSLHKTIKKVGNDIEDFKFNTAVSSMMILVNLFTEQKSISVDSFKLFLIILSPFAPHLADELWSKINFDNTISPDSAIASDNAIASDSLLDVSDSIFKQDWPNYNKDIAKDDKIELVVQVNGKVRDNIKVLIDISEDKAKEIALNSDKIKKWTNNKKIIKVVFVKGKLISIVVK